MEVANTDRRSNAALIGMTGDAAAVTVANNQAFLEMLSTNLYSRPKEAMVREILCNADDAHKDAGYTGPIEITLESNNTLIVRDRGKGIPHDQLVTIYGVYGGSTKSNDSMATGGFGLGCKSPWSYTDVFTVANNHDGIRTINSMVRVSADHNGMPAIIPLVNITTEETGLEVRVDIRPGDVNEFLSLIRYVVLRGGINATLNGNEISTYKYDNPESYTLLERPNFSNRETIMVKYGAVLYPVENHEIYQKEFNAVSHIMSTSNTLVLKAPPDSLVISPSRENLSYLDKTVKTIWILLRDFMKEVNRKSVPYAREAIKRGNQVYINRYGADWLDSHRNRLPDQYLSSPILPKPTEEMSVIEQVIHHSLVRNYPHSFAAFDLVDRVKKTTPLFQNDAWQRARWGDIAKWLVNPVATSDGHEFFRKCILQPLLQVLARNGLDHQKLMILDLGGWYDDDWRTVSRPFKLSALSDMRKRTFSDVYKFAFNTVIISHTIQGVRDVQYAHGDNEHFVYLVPRNHDEIQRVKDVFDKFGIPYRDITGHQQTKAAAGIKRAANVYPSLGWLRSMGYLSGRFTKVPELEKSRDQPKTSYIDDPEMYMLCTIRKGSDTRRPEGVIDSLYQRLLPMLPDKTAIVTTAVEVARLRKAGVKSIHEFQYDYFCKLWGERNVRQLWAYLAHRSNYETLTSMTYSQAVQIIRSQWFRNELGLKVDASETEIEKVHTLAMAYDYLYHVCQMVIRESGKPDKDADPFRLKNHLSHVLKNGLPKKFTDLHNMMQSKSLIRNNVINFDSILSLEAVADKATKEAISKILTITME